MRDVRMVYDLDRVAVWNEHEFHDACFGDDNRIWLRTPEIRIASCIDQTLLASHVMRTQTFM